MSKSTTKSHKRHTAQQAQRDKKLPDGVTVTPRPRAVAQPTAQPDADASASEPSTEAAPAPVDAGSTADGATVKKPRIAHYAQVTIRVHENSKVSIADLDNILAERVDAAGEELKSDSAGKRFKGTTFTIAPKGKARASAQERLDKQLEKLRATAERAGVSLESLLSKPAASVDTAATAE